MKANKAPCVMGVIYAHCSRVKKTPFTCFVFTRYSLACSSDQKKIEFRQYASMMFCPAKLFHTTSGINTNGFVPSSRIEIFISLSALIRISRPQCLHSVSTTTDKYSFFNRPCTKGAAIASSAQAPYRRSPLLKFSLWGVVSTVTG